MSKIRVVLLRIKRYCRHWYFVWKCYVRGMHPRVYRTSVTITLPESASSINGMYVEQLIVPIGVGEGQVRRIIGYDGTTRVATLDYESVTPPDQTTTFEMLPMG